MTKPRKRRRETYNLVKWQPLPTKTTFYDGEKRSEVLCRVAVVEGAVLGYVKTRHYTVDKHGSVSGVRLTATKQPVVHGYWLPARFTLDTSHARFVVDVDLVAHTTPRRHAAEIEQLRQVVTLADLKALARPATWSRLLVDNDSDQVLPGSKHLTDRHRLLVTNVTVLPLPNLPGRRGQSALVRSLQVVPGDLLRHALKAAEFYGALRPAAGKSYVGQLIARRDPVPTQPRQRAKSTQPTLERHQVVRDVYEAAPSRERTQWIMRRFDCAERTAAKYVKQSQIALGWGLAHKRSKRQRKSTKKGKQT